MKKRDIPNEVKKILNHKIKSSDLFHIVKRYKYDTTCSIGFYLEHKSVILFCKVIENEIIIDTRFEHYMGNDVFTVNLNVAKILTSKIYSMIEHLIVNDFKYTTIHFKFIPDKLKRKYEHLLVTNELGLL